VWNRHNKRQQSEHQQQNTDKNQVLHIEVPLSPGCGLASGRRSAKECAHIRRTFTIPTNQSTKRTAKISKGMLPPVKETELGEGLDGQNAMLLYRR
jgi:hypothetical protein